VKRIEWLACEYGRYGYRRITALLHLEGWRVNHKRVERIWREEGLKVPQKQPKRRRLWLNDGSCIRLRPTHRNHVWSYDFVMDRTSDGRPIRMLTIVDEFTRECLAFSLSLMPFCLAALTVATAAQVVWLPKVSWVRVVRLAVWATGLLLWFGGGIVSFAHALG